MRYFEMVCALGLIALLSSLPMAQNTGSTAAKVDKIDSSDTLVGRYIIVAGEKNGLKEPEERIQGTIVVFTKDSVVVTDKHRKEIYSASYTLKTTTNPCDIIMTSRAESSAGEIARGLIQKEGDKVRLIYALPTGEIPSGFKTKGKQLMFVMKKAQ
jgi:uncharacterized protein (TIGR03067 family)